MGRCGSGTRGQAICPTIKQGGGVAAARFPHEQKAQDYERSGDTSAPPHKNTQSATIAKMPTTSVTISPTETLVVVMRVRLPPA